MAWERFRSRVCFCEKICVYLKCPVKRGKREAFCDFACLVIHVCRGYIDNVASILLRSLVHENYTIVI